MMTSDDIYDNDSDRRRSPPTYYYYNLLQHMHRHRHSTHLPPTHYHIILIGWIHCVTFVPLFSSASDDWAESNPERCLLELVLFYWYWMKLKAKLRRCTEWDIIINHVDKTNVPAYHHHTEWRTTSSSTSKMARVDNSMFIIIRSSLHTNAMDDAVTVWVAISQWRWQW